MGFLKSSYSIFNDAIDPIITRIEKFQHDKNGYSAINVENGRGDLRSALSAGSGDPRRTPYAT